MIVTRYNVARNSGVVCFVGYRYTRFTVSYSSIAVYVCTNEIEIDLVKVGSLVGYTNSV